MNPAVSNLVVMLVMMQLARKINFEDPDILFYVRVGYLSCQAIAFLIYLITRAKINAKNDLTTLKYVEPANPLGGAATEKAVVTTVKDYDLQQVNAQIKSIFTSMAMMGFMHIYMKYTNPLFMQSVTAVKSACEANIVKIHLFGTPASGDLKRPFKAAPCFMQALSGAQDIKTDKHSVEAAEVSGTGGIKED